MKNKKYIILLLILLLGGIAYYLSIPKRGDFLKYERDFSIENFRDIHTIFVTKRNPRYHFILEKKAKNRWTVNGMPANMRIVKGMLATLHDLQIQYKPSHKAYTNVMYNLANHALKVEAYDKSGKLMKAFYIGGTPPDSYGSYAMMAGSDQPFVIHRKLMDNDIRPVFDLKVDQLRDPFLFPYKPVEIKSFSVDYPYDSKDGFILKRTKGDDFRLESIDKQQASVPSGMQANQSLMQNYLHKLRKVEIEGFINQHPLRDTLSTVIPFANINLRTADTSFNVQVYPFNAETVKIDIQNYKPGDERFFRYICLINNRDLTLVQRPLIEALFAKYRDFFVLHK